jgi:hypothetical protein
MYVRIAKLLNFYYFKIWAQIDEGFVLGKNKSASQGLEDLRLLLRYLHTDNILKYQTPSVLLIDEIM